MSELENTHNPVFLCVSATLRDPFFTPRDFPKSKAEVEISKPISLGHHYKVTDKITKKIAV
jgi:hypothetical protein